MEKIQPFGSKILKKQFNISGKIISAGLIFSLFLTVLLFAGCAHIQDIYKKQNYSLDDVNVDTFEARVEVINGYRGYAGKVLKISPFSGGTWADFSRTIYWDWDIDDEGYQMISVTMSVLVESPNSGRPQTSAYKPGKLTVANPTNIKWNGPANIGWTVQIGDENYAQFGGKPVVIPEGKWVDLAFSQAVDITHNSYGQIYLDGHAEQQGLLDMTLYIKNFRVTMRPITSFLAITFDDSPTDFTHFLLDKLDEEDITATFFVLGSGIEAMHPVQDRTLTAEDRVSTSAERKETIKRIFDDGHEIGILTNFNASTGGTESDLRAELEETRIAVQKAVYGENDYMNHLWITQYLRIPGDSDPETQAIARRVAQSMGLPIITGTQAVSDPSASIADTAEKISGGLLPWAVSINRDPRSDPAVLRVLEVLAPKLKTEGYIFVTLSEMTEKRRESLVPGRIYDNLNPDLH